MDLTKLSRGDRIIVATGLLLLLDLLFLPWYSFSFGPVTVTGNGLSGWNSFLGVLALLVTLAMVAQIIVARFTDAKLPDMPMPWPQVHMIGGYVVLGLLVLKLILHVSNLGFGAYLGILLAAGLAFGGFTVKNEASRAGSAG
ncbi:MAG TPA: hypothetical protein VET24_11385 [Actinomycetota bacterium]|nr:hypothetical protein [Actinomycetota bacterium]